MTKPNKSAGGMWNAGRVISARTFELNAAKDLQSLLQEKVIILPATPSEQIRAFQIGAHDIFVQLMRDDVPLSDLKAALRRYTTSTGYLIAVGLDQSDRYKFDGSIDAPVSEDNRARARKLVMRRFSKMQQRTDQAVKGPRVLVPKPEPEKPERPVLTINPSSGSQ